MLKSTWYASNSKSKKGKNTEFGAKISAICMDRYIFLHRISWENYNEFWDLKADFEEWKKLHRLLPRGFLMQTKFS